MANGGTAICPGSYDPVTNGHLDVITRTANVFDRVVVGVVNAQVRKSEPIFNAEERKAFLDDATAGLPNVEVQVFATLLVDFARDVGASVIVKGLRAISDFEYEFEMNQLNRKLAPDLESMYVIASPAYSLPVVHRGQGDGDVRRRRERSGSGRRGRGAEGAVATVRFLTGRGKGLAARRRKCLPTQQLPPLP